MINKAPGTSSCDQGILPITFFFGQVNIIIAAARTPHGTLNKKHQRQVAFVVMTPPMIGPLDNWKSASMVRKSRGLVEYIRLTR
jgi:hypothetical protein